jgi:hypothetical protein
MNNLGRERHRDTIYTRSTQGVCSKYGIHQSRQFLRKTSKHLQGSWSYEPPELIVEFHSFLLYQAGKHVDVILQTGFVHSAKDMNTIMSLLENYLTHFERNNKSLDSIMSLYKLLLLIATASTMGTARKEIVQTNFADLDKLSTRIKEVLSYAPSGFTEAHEDLITELQDTINNLSFTISQKTIGPEAK